MWSALHQLSVSTFGAESIPVRDASRSWLLCTCSRGLSSFARPKRSELRSAVDRAFGRARQARSTWPWSERAQVGPSVAQTDGSRARSPPLRAGQHCMPECGPTGGIAVIRMLEPAFASLLAEKPAVHCSSPLKSDRPLVLGAKWWKSLELAAKLASLRGNAADQARGVSR